MGLVMWNKLKEYFFSRRNSIEEESKSQEESKSEDKSIVNEESITQEIVSKEVNNDVVEKIEHYETFTSEIPIANPLSKLLSEIEGKGREDYPLLDKTYALNSRIPCADFSGFIKERLLEYDIDSVIVLMNGILSGSFQWDNESSWIEKPIRELFKYDFEKYINYENRTAIYDLLSLWILAFKSGGGTAFWITNKESIPRYMTIIMSCNAFKLTENFPELISTANKFIKEMRKQAPFWKDFPLYKNLKYSENVLPSEMFCEKFNSLSLGGRLTLYQSLFSHTDNYNTLSSFTLRNLGVDILDVLDEIKHSEILLIDENPTDVSLIKYVNKNELEILLNTNNIPFKKSWNKEKLYDAIVEVDYKIVERFVNENKKGQKFIKYQLNPKFKNDSEVLLKSVELTKPVYDTLLFIKDYK